MTSVWLLLVVLKLVVTSVSCTNITENSFGDPPPLPTTGVRLYQGVVNKTLPNYGMIAAGDFSDRDGGVGHVQTGRLDGLNDGLWCQSSSGSDNIGSWRFPDGSDVPANLDAKPIHMAHNRSQVGLLRASTINGSPYQGMYTCTIPDENGKNQTLVVWAAANGPYDDIHVLDPVTSEVSFIPSTKPRDTDPPELILSFNVMVVPPTNVTCQVGSTPMDVTVLSREVTAGEYVPSNINSPVTNVTVTLRTRQPGNYQCTVSVYRASGSDIDDFATKEIDVLVTGTPTSLQSMGIVDSNVLQLSWSAPPSDDTPPVAGYEVFYAMSGSDSTESGGNTAKTTLSVPLPRLDVTYDFFVVAFSDEDNALPSKRSETINIDPSMTVASNIPASDVTQSAGSSAIAVGIVSVLLVVVIVIIITVVVIIFWRFRSKSKSSSFKKQPHSIQFSKTPAEEDEAKLATVPVIESCPSLITVEMGQQVKIDVCVTGTPKPSYLWYHYGQLVEEDYAHKITEDGCLIMETAEGSHTGSYKLVAKNSAGVAEKTLVLIVVREEEDEGNAAVDDTTLGQLPLAAIPVAEFGLYVFNCHADNHKGFRNLYWSLPSKEDEHSVTVAITQVNKPLNRFGNITVYDDNRIVLKPIRGYSDCQHDYINASYIDGYSIYHHYIATQGPMTKTLVDFWRLVWQEKPQTIVMVTNLKEGDKMKCQQYWPDARSENYGPFIITLIEQQVFTDYTFRYLQVELSHSYENPYRVSQYHFTSWPDHGVPDYATAILTMHRQIKQSYNPEGGPMLVHCSAGVGRTGTFLAIDMALDKIENEQVVDISNIIIRMRQQRMKMVQALDQLMFIYDAILESITCGDTQIPTAELSQVLDQLSFVDPETGKTGFQQQFDVLTQVTPNPAQVMHRTASRYPELNRTLDFAPSDKHRVPLKECKCDYINATFVNGYKQKKAFIITQSPMENTCRDFWKMVFQRNSGVIIMLCHTKENGQETCFQYWPYIGERMVFGELQVVTENEVEYHGFFERSLSVTDMASGVVHRVIQFHVINWSSPGHCSNLQTIVSVQEEMCTVQRTTGNNPVVIHCSDTVGRSGMFCAIATAIDRCKTEGVVDVFQVVKVQRIQKPGLVQDVDQYQVVFAVILAFLDSFDMYTNFQ